MTWHPPRAIPEPEPDTAVPPAPVLAFAPIHKRAFGTAVGLAVGLLVFALTAVHLVTSPAPSPDIALLSQYFYGYSVTWLGSGIGFLWGLFTGFIAGWFLAFTRNLVIAAWIFVIRARAELSATRDFLDHI